MADLASDHNLGEPIGDHIMYRAVEYDATISKGDNLKITGVNSDGIPKVQSAGADEKVAAIAEFDGSQGDIKRAIMFAEFVKVTFGGAISPGAAVKAAASNKWVSAVRTVTIPSGATTVTSTSAQPSMTVEAGVASGYCISNPSADADTGLICFTGGITP